MPSYKKYICTRPLLASKLLEDGFTGTRVVNPYHQDRPAWTFDFSVSLAVTVAEYYQSIEEKIPNIIQTYLRMTAPQTAADVLGE